MMTLGPYSRRLMENSTERALGGVLQNLGMGIMGLSQKNPAMAMKAFARPLDDPRKAMMEAAYLDMASQKMATQQAQAAREAQQMERAQSWAASQPPEIQSLVDVLGPQPVAQAMLDQQFAEGKPPDRYIQNPDGTYSPNPVYLELLKAEEEVKAPFRKPLVQVNQGARFSENYQPVYNEEGELVEVVPIKGSKADPMAQPRTYTPEQAGRTAAQMSGIESVRNVRDYLFDESGKVDFEKVRDMNVPILGTSVPWTEGRQRRQEFLDALSAQLRAETGAAASPAELENMAERYLPAVGDTDEAVKSKLDRLEKVLETGIGLTDPARNQTEETSDPLGLR